MQIEARRLDVPSKWVAPVLVAPEVTAKARAN